MPSELIVVVVLVVVVVPSEDVVVEVSVSTFMSFIAVSAAASPKGSMEGSLPKGSLEASMEASPVPVFNSISSKVAPLMEVSLAFPGAVEDRMSSTNVLEVRVPMRYAFLTGG